jgi:group I intron endonuclease
MTIGIYALTWEGTDKVYIGLSTRIEQRFMDHVASMKANKHDNFKVQQAYITYGIPSLIIIEKCSVEELNSNEVYWIEEFDSIENGFNIIEGGGSSYGHRHTTSKYSKIQILKTFILLAKTSMSYISISNRTKVAKGTVARIAQALSHTWLQAINPEMYELATRNRTLLSNYNRSIGRTGVGNTKYTYTFISPLGEIYSNSCITNFCKTVGKFDNVQAAKQGFSKIINGTRTEYFGWKCIRSII